MTGGVGKSWTKQEREAGANGTRSMTEAEPAPQKAAPTNYAYDGVSFTECRIILAALITSASCGCDGTFVVCRRLHREPMLYCMTFQKVYFARIGRLSTIGFPATTNGGIIPRL